ncbi:MAG TPA: RraA family protein [Candidatus Dormibacteraeota bacterium]|nr:RraA family protein [Candidatus Dormibacteraeota bacterium]
MFVERPRGPEPDPSVINMLKTLSPSTLGHLTDVGFPRGLRPLFTPISIVGPAVTVRIPHLDSAAVHCAMDVVKPGDVVVVEQCGDEDRAPWGALVTTAAMAKGVAGAVVQGGVTDAAQLRAWRFPIFSRTVSALTTRILGIEGALNVPIAVGGAVVRPGDIVWADENGIAVLSPEEAARYASIVAEKEAAEPPLLERIRRGESLAELSGARELLRRNAAGENV